MYDFQQKCPKTPKCPDPHPTPNPRLPHQLYASEVCEKSGSNNGQSKLKFLEAEILKLRNENTSLKDDNKTKLKIIELLTT